MRGPICAHLANIIIWKRSFGIRGNIEHVNKISHKFGGHKGNEFNLALTLTDYANMSLFELRGLYEEDHYSTQGIEEFIRRTRPWPQYPTAPVQRVANWMLDIRNGMVCQSPSNLALLLTHYQKTNLQHWSDHNSAPTSVFLNAILALQKHVAKWQLYNKEVGHWPYNLQDFPQVQLERLEREMNQIVDEEPPPLTDEQLADPNGYGAIWTAQQIHNRIKALTVRGRSARGRRIRQIAKQRKSRRSTFGLLPERLRMPYLADDQIFWEDEIPDFELAKAKNVIMIEPFPEEERKEKNGKLVHPVIVRCSI
jgi:hypothetical protein